MKNKSTTQIDNGRYLDPFFIVSASFIDNQHCLWPERTSGSNELKRKTLGNNTYNPLLRNFMAEIPRKWLTLALRRKSPLDVFRNEIYSQDRCT